MTETQRIKNLKRAANLLNKAAIILQTAGVANTGYLMPNGAFADCWINDIVNEIELSAKKIRATK